MSIRQAYVFTLIENLSKKYGLNLRDMHLNEVKINISKEDWEQLSDAVKYGSKGDLH
jgi:hypothetical protein|tara:strand:- start:1433 stop:1603 length:171 start_codon:yes stop_codon:yes gene_type:complete